ncbi:MAG: hypothetical protein IKN86_10910 [Bacteroidaceae bacterium]|nr:hypothetical protein [Bacteroidaceae bacterium]
MVEFNIRSLGMKILLCLVISSVAASISAQNYSTRRQGSYPSRPMRSYSSSEANAIARNVYNMYSERMDKDKTNDKDKVKDKKKEKKDKKKDLEETIQEQPSLNENGSSNEGENASLSSDDIELVATGDGSTKDEATKSALRSAIEQVFGTFVSSNTKILNDELVKDEIVTVSSGNIKSFKSISEKEIDGNWQVTVQAVVSVGKLIKYVQSKGAEAEFAGATFAMNVKMNQLYEKNQKTALKNLGKQLRTLFLTSFDYEINVSEPKPFNGRYFVPIIVTVKANKNAEACYQLYHKTLSALSTYSRGQEDAKGIINGTNKYYLSINQYPALEGIEEVMKECICNFTLSDGSHEYVGHYNYNNNSPKVELLYSGTQEVFISTSRLYFNKERESLSIRREHDFGKDPFLPIIANSNYAGNVIATITFNDLSYELDELSKISGFKIRPTITME